MKKTLFALALPICIIALAVSVSVARAEENDSHNQGSSTQKHLPIGGKLQVQFGGKLERNAEIRNIRATQTADIKVINKTGNMEIKGLRASTTLLMKENHASSSMIFKEFKGVRKEIRNRMQRDIFEIRKNTLVKELTFSLNNLTTIRGRINDYISKVEASGTPMLDARASLVIADTDLAKAKVALDAFAAFNYATSTSATASSTAEVDLIKPRKAGDDAIKAIKDARDALKKTVAIIKGVTGKDHTDGDKDEDKKDN